MGKPNMLPGYYSHAEAAQQIGITKTTLFLWEKQNKIDKAKRDRNNYRVFTDEDIAKIKAFKDRITVPV